MNGPSLQYLLNKVKYHTNEAKKYATQYRARYHELVDESDNEQPLAKIGNGEYAVEIEAQPRRATK